MTNQASKSFCFHRDRLWTSAAIIIIIIILFIYLFFILSTILLLFLTIILLFYHKYKFLPKIQIAERKLNEVVLTSTITYVPSVRCDDGYHRHAPCHSIFQKQNFKMRLGAFCTIFILLELAICTQYECWFSVLEYSIPIRRDNSFAWLNALKFHLQKLLVLTVLSIISSFHLRGPSSGRRNAGSITHALWFSALLFFILSSLFKRLASALEPGKQNSGL